VELLARANADDNPTWEEAMNVVEREEWMNVLPGTWAFRCKRFPDGSK
jgi:hypothetical protein